ncbi:hypothetical protein, partial [Escherichia marmotae]|uniref:hypothetical protein n=1 Tax=Escherichia marmotae TaxID=1499973 RepID=UPI001F4CDBDD
MRENTARACRQERANYQNCNILRCVPSVFSGGTVLLSGSSAPRKIVDEFILLQKLKSRKRLVRTVLIFTESSDQLSRAT